MRKLQQRYVQGGINLLEKRYTKYHLQKCQLIFHFLSGNSRSSPLNSAAAKCLNMKSFVYLFEKFRQLRDTHFSEIISNNLFTKSKCYHTRVCRRQSPMNYSDKGRLVTKLNFFLLAIKIVEKSCDIILILRRNFFLKYTYQVLFLDR